MKIITGYTGTSHVTAADDRALNAGIVGKGKYVLDINEKLEAVLVSPTTVRIKSGDLVMNGVHARIEYGESEELEIEAGTEGYNRKDRIVARYEKQGDVESVRLLVITGAPSTGSATAPDYEQGDVLKGDLVVDYPLYTIEIDGLNVMAINQRFQLAKQLIDVYLKDTIDQMNGGLKNDDIKIGTYDGKDVYRHVYAPSDRSIAADGVWVAEKFIDDVGRILRVDATCIVSSEEILDYFYPHPDDNDSLDNIVYVHPGGVLASLPFSIKTNKRIDFVVGSYQTWADDPYVQICPAIYNRTSESVMFRNITIVVDYVKN